MASTRSLALALAALPGLASAYFTSLSVAAGSEAVRAGGRVQASLMPAIYVQNWEDFAIAWGVKPRTWDCTRDVCVGTQVGYTPLYPDVRPEPGKAFVVDVNIPESAGLEPGDYQLVAAIPHLVGASGLVAVHSFEANITIVA